MKFLKIRIVIFFSISWIIFFLWKSSIKNTNFNEIWKLLHENNCIFSFQWMNYISEHCLSEYYFNEEENKNNYNLTTLEIIYTEKNYQYKDEWNWFDCWMNVNWETYVNPSCLNPTTSNHYKKNKFWYFTIIVWKSEENSVCNWIWKEYTIRQWHYVYKMSVCN